MHRPALLPALSLAIALLGVPTTGKEPARITIDSTQRFQTMAGFGVNFNGTCFRDAQKPMVDMLIDDLGATIFRLDPYGIINWEAENDNNDPNVMNWEYQNDRYSIPTFESSKLYLATPGTDCGKTDTFAVNDGVAKIRLPAEAVFTLVGIPKR